MHSLFFYPDKKPYDNPFVRAYAPQDIYFKTTDGLTLHGWFFKAHDAAVMLVLHGNAQNISTHVNGVLWLVQAGFNVFIIDYRGYGQSEGEPTAAGANSDAEAALETLLAMPSVQRPHYRLWPGASEALLRSILPRTRRTGRIFVR